MASKFWAHEAGASGSESDSDSDSDSSMGGGGGAAGARRQWAVDSDSESEEEVRGVGGGHGARNLDYCCIDEGNADESSRRFVRFDGMEMGYGLVLVRTERIRQTPVASSRPKAVRSVR